MLEVGHEFKRNGVQYCVIDFMLYNQKQYCLLSVEKKDEKLDFEFYECSFGPNGGINMNQVNDTELLSNLFKILEKESVSYE